jgi:prepilin-type N-terminal cleavage/methylation domain-containing protein
LFAVLSVPSALSALKKGVRRRQGMTLLEVLLTLAIFLVGSVGIIGLFVAASVLHKDAVERRTASYIAETLLANVQAKPMNEVFAKTTVLADGGGTINVPAVVPDAADPIAAFNGAVNSAPGGFLLLQGSAIVPVPDELVFYSQQPTVGPPGVFNAVTRNLTGAGTGVHAVNSVVLQPRSWDFGLTANLASGGGSFNVYAAASGGAIPTQGYLVIDKEWMPYTWNSGASQFTVPDLDGNGTADRGFGLTVAAPHNAGAPVTVAQEYPGYPDFYYTIQYYPVNATGAEARVIVMVGFGTPKRFHVEAFEGVYTPGQY